MGFLIGMLNGFGFVLIVAAFISWLRDGQSFVKETKEDSKFKKKFKEAEKETKKVQKEFLELKKQLEDTNKEIERLQKEKEKTGKKTESPAIISEVEKKADDKTAELTKELENKLNRIEKSRENSIRRFAEMEADAQNISSKYKNSKGYKNYVAFTKSIDTDINTAKSLMSQLASDWDASVFNRLTQLIGKITSNLHQANIALKDFYKYIKNTPEATKIKVAKKIDEKKIPSREDIENAWKLITSAGDIASSEALANFNVLLSNEKTREAIFMDKDKLKILENGLKSLRNVIITDILKPSPYKNYINPFKRNVKIFLDRIKKVKSHTTKTGIKPLIEKDIDVSVLKRGILEQLTLIFDGYLMLLDIAEGKVSPYYLNPKHKASKSIATAPAASVGLTSGVISVPQVNPSVQTAPKSKPFSKSPKIDEFIKESRKFLGITKKEWLNDKEIRKLAKKYKIKKGVFLNLGNTHWVLQLSEPVGNLVKVYDPIKGERTIRIYNSIRAMVFTEDFKTKEVVDHIRSNNLPAEIDENGIYIMSGLDEGINLWKELTKNLKLKVKTDNHQQDSWNCGIYVVYYAMIAKK